MTARALGKQLALVACRCATHAARQRPAVLLYHSVGGTDGIPPGLFARQMDYVAEHFRCIRLGDLPADSDAADGGDRAVAAACVTFDDGYRDNVEVALPVLETRGIPATFFLVPPLLGRIFPSRASHPVLDLGQARDLVAGGHEIGAHTLSHPRLTRVGGAEARHEIEGSKQELEDQLGVAVTSFAYPKGDYDDRVRGIVAACGFRVAATIREGLVGPDPDWLALPRVSGRPSETMLAFRCKLHPAIDLYERLVRRA